VRGAIVAMSSNRVIGVNGNLPWDYPADLKRFKERTLGTTIIMGRRTWESLGGKALPKRRNIVITSSALPNVETFSSIEKALNCSDDTIWFIGGALLYQAALSYCDLIDITHIPDKVFSDRAVYFPELDTNHWQPGPIVLFPADDQLKNQKFYRHNRQENV